MPATLHRARDTGEAAVAWLRSLAGRQEHEHHALVRQHAAEAIERASHQEVIPGFPQPAAGDRALELGGEPVCSSMASSWYGCREWRWG